MRKLKTSICIILTLISLTCFAQTQKQTAALEKFLGLKEIRNSVVGFKVFNMDTGETILENNANMSVTPASVMKLFTSSAALDLLEPDKQFKTEIAYSGSIDNQGVLTGDIYILGYGDPTLGSDFFKNHYNSPQHLLMQWVNAIKSEGIRKIEGGVVAIPVKIGKGVIPDKWLWEDIANYYGAPATGLNFSDNQYFVHFKTGQTEGSPTQIIKTVPDDIGLSFENYVTSKSTGGDQAYIFYGDNINQRVIRGTLPWKRDNFAIRGSIPNPAQYLAAVFTRSISLSGISISSDPVFFEKLPINTELTLVHTTHSPKLIDIIDIINIRSFNLYAETVALHLSEEFNQDFREIISEFWKKRGMDTNGLFIDDACGLSPFNGATPSQIVFLLDYMKNKSPNSELFLKSLPVSGESGTLRGVFTHANTKGKIKAKSGSMTRVRAYAGYMEMKNGDEAAFCIIVNNYDCTAIRVRRLIEDLFTEII